MSHFNPITKKETVSDTLVFVPHTIPNVNINKFLRQAASHVVTLLKTSQPILPTPLQIGNQIQNGLYQLAIMLKTNKANRILTNTHCHLQSPNHNRLIPSKQPNQQYKSFHEDLNSLQLSFHELQKLLLTLKTKNFLKHTQNTHTYCKPYL